MSSNIFNFTLFRHALLDASAISSQEAMEINNVDNIRAQSGKMRHELVSKLDRETQVLGDQIEHLKIELELRRTAGQGAASEHKVALERNAEKHQRLRWKYEKISNEDSQRCSSLGGYVSTMRTVTGPGSVYVQTIEGQACRSLHLMGVKKNQRDLMNQQAKQLIDYMREVAHTQAGEMVQLSKEMMTCAFEIGCERRTYAARCEEVLGKQRTAIAKLEVGIWNACLKNGKALRDASSETRRPLRRASVGCPMTRPFIRQDTSSIQTVVKLVVSNFARRMSSQLSDDSIGPNDQEQVADTAAAAAAFAEPGDYVGDRMEEHVAHGWNPTKMPSSARDVYLARGQAFTF